MFSDKALFAIVKVSWLQGSTPPPPWYQIPEDKVPYVVFLLVTALAFILGGLARPLVKSLGNALLLWIKGWGKKGDFRRRYLTYVVSRCRHLTLLPANIVAARWDYRRTVIELENLYTTLSLEEIHSQREADDIQPKKRRLLGHTKKEPRNRLQELWWRIHPPVKPSAGALGEIIETATRLIIRGDPGCGKTTLLRYLAISCARSLRNDKRDGDDPRLVRQRLGWKKPRFPIYVNLGLFADVLEWSRNRRLIDALIDSLTGELRQRYPKGFFESQLMLGHCLVLFDGFDELGGREARSRMAHLIADLVNNNNHPSNRFIVSTRIVGYEGQLDTYGFAIRTVQDLTPEAVRELVARRYRAIAIGEGLGLSEQEQEDLIARFDKRVQVLLQELAKNESLKALTVNPLLLSLIVLVSLVQVQLPKQRHMLYRDCVEILTERWQEYRQAEADIQEHREAPQDALTLEQKLTLLRHIALQLQSTRKAEERQVLMSLKEVRGIITKMLPDFLASVLPKDVAQREQVCWRKAGDILENIREESGILVEKGLDLAGEPVIGFSHLTFQEYLAADALRQYPGQMVLLEQNLFNSVWREVLLLLVSMQDGSSIVQACLEDKRQPYILRYLLAGRCLAEKGPLNATLRERILAGLQTYFYPVDAPPLRQIEYVFSRVGGDEHYDWLLENLSHLLPEDTSQTLSTPPDAVSPGYLFQILQQALCYLLETHHETVTRYQVGNILACLNDPRFDPDRWHLPFEERLGFVLIPAGKFLMGSSKKYPDAVGDEKPQHVVELPYDYYLARYPVTVAQFHTFVEETEYRKEHDHIAKYSLRGLDNHPIVSITWSNALEYCRWLEGKLKGVAGEMGDDPFWAGLAGGKLGVTLPSEAEWEKAARGGDGRDYPWEGEFDPDKANTYETGLGSTSAVGCFPTGASPYGLLDMSGNVWEWTRSLWGKDWNIPDFKYPYDPGDGREDLEADSSIFRVMRGGSFDFYRWGTRCSYRNWFPPGLWFYHHGFRVVVSPILHDSAL